MATGPWRDPPPLPAADVAVRAAGTATQLGSWPGVLGRNWQYSVMLPGRLLGLRVDLDPVFTDPGFGEKKGWKPARNEDQPDFHLPLIF